jgi:hypothetical protein
MPENETYWGIGTEFEAIYDDVDNEFAVFTENGSHCAGYIKIVGDFYYIPNSVVGFEELHDALVAFAAAYSKR